MLAGSMEDFLSWAQHGVWPANTCLIDFLSFAQAFPASTLLTFLIRYFFAVGELTGALSSQ